MQVQCLFSVLECPHDGQPLFSPEYKRSNRTRMSKILRCFPHCCPTHRPRSYCGSALHLHVKLVTNEKEDAGETKQVGEDEEQLPLWTLSVPSPTQALQDLIVYGRFEVYDSDDPFKTELSLGQHIPSASITATPDPSVIWVPGTQATSGPASRLADGSASSPSRVFVLNEGDGESHHWEYDWRSGTSQRKRACQHQFRAYVFLADAADPSTWQVVGFASSTPFTLSSYRKQDEDDMEGMATDLAGTRASPPLMASMPAPAIPQLASVLPPPSNVNEILLVRQFQATAGDTTKLAVVINLLAVVDVSWIDPDILTRYAVSILGTNPDRQAASVLDGAVDENLREFARHCVAPLLTALRIPSPQPRVPLNDTAWFAAWRGTLELCIDVVCHLVMDGTLARLQIHLHRAAALRDEQHIMTSYVEFVALLASEIERIVRQLSDHASLDLLVDNIVSCVCDEDPEFDWMPRFTRDEAIRLLRNTSLLGLDAYREQLRQCAMADLPTSGFQSDMSQRFTGGWVCLSIDESASHSLRIATPDFGISALAALQVLVSSHSFDVLMDGDGTSLRLRSGWRFFSHLWSTYILDGQLHASAVMPHGISSHMWMCLGAGAVVGDYRAALRYVEDGSVVLDLEFFVYAVNAPSYCAQLTLVPMVDRTHQLHVHARVFRTRLIGDARALRQEELSLLTPEQRSDIIAFTSDDLVAAAAAVYERVH